MLEPDTVLRFLSGDLTKSANSAKAIYKQFEIRYQMDYTDFVRSLERLFREGYLAKEAGQNKETIYLLTYEGKQFAKRGGYLGGLVNPETARSHSTKGLNISRYILITIVVTIVGLIIFWFKTR